VRPNAINFPGGLEIMIRSYQGRLPQIPASCYVDLSAQLIGDVTLGEHLQSG